MPTTEYMQVHARHDHSLRIPRPDRTLNLGTPNVCNACHADKDAAWAAARLKSWGMGGKPGAQTFAEAFALSDADGPGAMQALIGVATDGSAIARASALHRLNGALAPVVLDAAEHLTRADDPMIRVAAVDALSGADAAVKARALAPLLGDLTRLVRMRAARALAGEAEASLAQADRKPFDAALADYVAGQMFNAERPESHANVGGLHLARGRIDAAQAEFAKALELDKTFAPAAIQIAESASRRSDETAAGAGLEKALADNPASGPLAHVLALSLIRQKRIPEAMAKLELAVQRAPEAPHYAYVHAIGLHDMGELAKAIDVLRAALTRRPNDRELLSALASYEAQTGDFASSLDHAQTLEKLEPEDRRWRRLAETARASRSPARTKNALSRPRP